MRRLVIATVILALLLGPAVVLAAKEELPEAGTFAPAGALTTPRAFVLHAAATMPDGRVLVMGGYDLDGIMASAQVWDSQTDTFTATAPLAEARMQHTATALADGRVLVIGGISGDDREWYTATTTEVWEPTSGAFASGERLIEARAGHTATALPDGRVLVVGGYGTDTEASSAEIWEPATGAFSIASVLGVGRERHTATLLTDGRVLVVGGVRNPEERLASAEIWDLATGAFTPTGVLGEPRGSHTATLLPDGRVLVVGGYGEDYGGGDVRGLLATAEVWDPATGEFGAAGTLAEARSRHTATALADGRVLLIGGWGQHPPDSSPSMGGPLASAEVWDPASGEFMTAGTMAVGRSDHTASALADGRVLVVGGAASSEALPRLLKAEAWAPTPR